MPEYKFKTFFFKHSRELDELINEYVEKQQEEDFEFVDVKFAQSSASGTGMSVLIVMRKL